MFNCHICNKSYKTQAALSGHKRVHGQSNGTIHQPKCCCLITKREIVAKDLIKFQTNLKHCLHCNTPLDSNRKYCNQSCSASATNIRKPRRSIESRNKTSESTKASYIKRGYIPRVIVLGPKTSKEVTSKEVLHDPFKRIKLSLNPRDTQKLACGPYSKLYLVSCAHCKSKTLERKQYKYCRRCARIYSPANRQRYKFCFNVFKFPNLFDLNLISTLGFYSPGGKYGKWNISGISRDHRVSVNDALLHDYDPYYITHPINCELMPHSENNKKKTKSSISYDELVLAVNRYELETIHFSASRI